MNGYTTRKKRQMLITNSGEYCKCCGYYKIPSKLVINHKDNNLKNNELDNLQILCRSCVNLKYQTSEHNDLCVKTKTKEETPISINREKEPKFKEFVYRNIPCGSAIALKAIINSGAEEIDASPVTTRHYLDKMVSRSGELMEFEHDGITMVMFKEKNN